MLHGCKPLETSPVPIVIRSAPWRTRTIARSLFESEAANLAGSLRRVQEHSRLLAGIRRGDRHTSDLSLKSWCTPLLSSLTTPVAPCGPEYQRLNSGSPTHCNLLGCV